MSASIPTSPQADTPAIATYHRIAQAIAFLRAHQAEQPDLATVAQHVGLSEAHFQRVFTQWAGVSPKRFLQYLTVEYAKARLAQTKSLLDLSLEAGLSGPGRLHDLFVSLEAMSPGEYKAGGAGLTLHYGIHETPFGLVLLAQTARGICHLQFLADLEDPTHDIRQTWPQAELIEAAAATQEGCDRIFTPAQSSPPAPLTLWVKGTNFQIQVWRALLNIPPGHLTTYQALATCLGRPTAARAVGNAVGKNPIAYLIPCHRVLRESGELGGYRWGVERKAALLGWEASHCHRKT